VTKLVAENEHLKQMYKQLYDSIKPSRVQSKEQCNDLIRQVNLKSAEISDLNASLQEKVLVITALKESLRKLKGKDVVNEVVPSHSIDPELLKIDVAPLAPKLRKNRTVHTDYISHTQEEAANLKEIVKRVKLLSSASGSKSQDNTKKDRIQRTPRKAKKNKLEDHLKTVVQIVLCYLDCGCSKHMTGDHFQLINYVQKFLGTVKFGNGHVAKIMGYEAVATACFTKNRSIIRLRDGKTPYELLHNKLPELLFFHMFGALCYPTNDRVNLLSSASGSKSQDNTKNDRIQRTPRKAKKNKLEDHLNTVRPSLNKKSVVDTKATSSLTNSMSNVNSDLKCASCNGCLFYDNHDACVVAYINSVNASIKSKSVMKPLKRKIWHSTGKMFTTVGHRWNPIGRTFSLVVQIVLCYLDCGCSKHMTGDRFQLINYVQKFLGTVKFGNGHEAKIMGYACAMGKSMKKSHKPKSKDTNQEKLYLLHMDLCGPMCVKSVNGKKYIIVIVDDYSRFTWVKFLRSKDEAPDFIIKFMRIIQVRLKVPVRRIRTDNGTKFVNQTLRDYYEEVGISHETSVARSPQQNGVVERRNRTLTEATHTMLIYAQAPLFLWAEAVATACFTKNRSIIRLRDGKTPYELLHNKLPNLLFFHMFGALCYPTNDSENLGKLQPKADIKIFIGYATTKKAF
nr:integrase, catalytic region, zinc finger, CCHC-type, peptidase aspartic, catalytic [Tanacetum cinerariifolium]